ncbi:MAG: Mur ligase, partial [Gammaproteobacteria bacterium]
MSLADQLTRMRTQFPILGKLNQAKITLFFSISDGQDRARTFIIHNTDFNTAWLQGISELENIQKSQNLISPWIRIEAIHAVTQLSLAHYEQQLTKVKRNYSRKGISFDSEFKLAITEQELNANA